MRTRIETNVNKFAVSNRTSLKLDVHTLINYLRLIFQYELYVLPNIKVSAAKDHGKNYIKDMPALVHHLLRNGLLIEFKDTDSFLSKMTLCNNRALSHTTYFVDPESKCRPF